MCRNFVSFFARANLIVWTYVVFSYVFISTSSSLSFCFNGHFPRESGLAGFIEAKDDLEVVVTKSCKALVKTSPPTNQHPTSYKSESPSCVPTNSVRAPKGKHHDTIPYHTMLDYVSVFDEEDHIRHHESHIASEDCYVT